MQADEIKINHCYFMGLRNGRRIIARVTRFVERPIRSVAADGSSSSHAIPTARFVWRNAAYPPGWSIGEQQLPLAVFAGIAVREVDCVNPDVSL